MEVASSKRETVEIQKELFSTHKSKIRKYADLIVGRPGLLALVKYESIVMLSANCPGAFGLLLRSWLYPRLLGSCGRNVTFGSHVVLRHPHKISIGDNVVIDDQCVLDAKGTDNRGIRIGSGVFVGRNTILSCKNGDIVLEDGVNIGFTCEIFSASEVIVGARTLVAAYAYLIGGGHEFDQADLPVLDQGRSSTGIRIGRGAWIGAGVQVLDGVSLGDGCIVGAGAVVTRDVGSQEIVAGVPATVIGRRQADNPPGAV